MLRASAAGQHHSINIGMGCGAGRGVKPTSDQANLPLAESSVSNPPVVAATWATKPVLSPTAAVDTSREGKNSLSSREERREDMNVMVLSDADEEDEIEIIDETPWKKPAPKWTPSMAPRQDSEQRVATNPAANGQEPPEAVELDTRPKKVEMQGWVAAEKKEEPLTKKQQEEAAKLAERRKKFDNQRYQQDSSMSDAGRDQTHVRTFGPKSYGDAPNMSSQKEIPLNKPPPTTDSIIGLNQFNHQPRQQAFGAFESLPGGIDDDDDLMTVQKVPKASKKNKQSHEEIDDDEAERMMVEILEDFDV